MTGWRPDNASTLSTTCDFPRKFPSKRVRVSNGKTRNALTSNAQSPLKGWEYPAGSAIKIREVINRNEGKDFGVSYRVSIPTKLAGKRILKQFASSKAAATWAKQQYDGFASSGKAHFDLTARERDEAIKALAILKDSGIT